MKEFPKVFVSILMCELVGIVGTPFTISAIPTWYATLQKPYFSPPNWVFGPVWTILYFMMGISAYIVWSKGWKKKKIKQALVLFAVHLGFNFLWSVLFFGLRSPVLGLVGIFTLIVFLSSVIIRFHRIAKPAAYLLLPYFMWVSFATILNLSIFLLNR